MQTATKAYILIITILAQCILTLILLNTTHMNRLHSLDLFHQYSYPMIILLCALSLCAVFGIYNILKILRSEKNSLIALNHSKEVIDVLHGQKHDFNNHLNLLSSMLQAGKYDRALDYIFRVSQKVDSTFSISKIENPEVSAIIYRKCAIAESKGITVELDIHTSLEHLKMDSIDLCKVLFNLLDNAIYELERCQEDEKILTIDISEYVGTYVIAICNSFPVLYPGLYDKIFHPRYSTKEGEGHGYGLSIVKQLVEKNKGKITIESYQGVGTIFTLFLPQKNAIAHSTSSK